VQQEHIAHFEATGSLSLDNKPAMMYLQEQADSLLARRLMESDLQEEKEEVEAVDKVTTATSSNGSRRRPRPAGKRRRRRPKEDYEEDGDSIEEDDENDDDDQNGLRSYDGSSSSEQGVSGVGDKQTQFWQGNGILGYNSYL